MRHAILVVMKRYNRWWLYSRGYMIHAYGRRRETL